MTASDDYRDGYAAGRYDAAVAFADYFRKVGRSFEMPIVRDALESAITEILSAELQRSEAAARIPVGVA